MARTETHDQQGLRLKMEGLAADRARANYEAWLIDEKLEDTPENEAEFIDSENCA